MAFKSENLKFRHAKTEDIKFVCKMIQELADFEKMSDGPKLTEKDLIRDCGLNGDPECCQIYVLELENDTAETKESVDLIGYAICFFSYSTWMGKTFFLEDIYIKPKYRGFGAGRYMFHQLAVVAKNFNCKRWDFHVLGWNSARKFYEKMGAIDLTETEDWHFYRLTDAKIKKLTEEKF